MQKSTLKTLFSLFNGNIIPLQPNSKIPLEKGFKTKSYSLDYLLNHNGNFALVVPNNMLIIDIDSKQHDGLLSWLELKQSLSIDLSYNVKTVNNGFHIYTKHNISDFKPYFNLNDYKGIDFIGPGRLITIPPSVINETSYKLLSTNIQTLPINLLNMLNQLSNDKNTVINILNTLSSNISYDDWLRVLMVIFNVFQGSNEGLALAKKWSHKDYNSYSENEIDSKWNSFKDLPNKVGIGTLIVLSKNLSNSKCNSKPLPSFKLNNVDSKECNNITNNIIFLKQEDKFYNIKTKSKFSIATFNKLYLDTLGCSNKNLFKIIKCIDSFVYEPLNNSSFIYEEDAVFYNSYKPPILIDKPFNQEWVDLVIKHINIISNNDKNLLYWIIWQIKHPGKLIRWMPVIQSIQGTGKSFLLNLIQEALGFDNVGIIHANTLFDKYTSWGYGKCCNFFEEIKINGQNRYEVLNRIKPYITNDFINIRSMYKEEFKVRNTSNYIALTNYIDCLPYEDSDRRLYPIISPIKSISHLENLVKIPSKVYFHKLYSGLSYINSFVSWCHNQSIPDYIYESQVAPNNNNPTKEILNYIDNSKHEYFDEITDLLDTTPGITSDYIVNDILKVHLNTINDFININKIKPTLYKMGFLPLKNPIRFNNKLNRCWVRSNYLQDIDFIVQKIKDDFVE